MQSSQEHLKTIITIIYAKFGGQTECIREGIFENRKKLDVHVMINCQLSKKVSADQCPMTISQAQVYDSLR